MERNTRMPAVPPDWLKRMLQEHEAAKVYQDLTPAELEDLELQLSTVVDGIRDKLAEPYRRRHQNN